MNAIINFQKLSAKSIQASNRIARFLAERYGFFVVDNKSACSPRRYDTIIIVNGCGLYCDFLPELVNLCKANSRFIWVGNDYAIKIPSQIQFITEREFYLVSAYDNFQKVKHYFSLDWNRLSFVPNKVALEKRFTGLAYYGAYRLDREPDFKKYLGTNKYTCYISTSRLAESKFKVINPKAVFFSMPNNLLSTFGQFSDTVYIEDRKSHDLYCSPANRFYEYLSAGVMTHFDASCEGTFQKAGIDISDYIVTGPDDIVKRMGDVKLFQKQRRELYLKKNYFDELISDTDAVFKAILK